MDLKQAEKKIKKSLNSEILDIAKNFIDHNFQIYLVGGYIRDILLKRKKEQIEYDLTTDATPQQVKKIFKRVIPTGIKHGTVTVLKDSIHYEVTTFRCDGKYTDGRHPDEIQYTKTIDEDLRRRDFTINAFALNLKSFKLIDNFNGLKDLKDKLIRTIGIPDDRFAEDGLRLMRAVRFASVLGFKIDEKTYNSIKKNLFMIDKVAIERIKDEFSKIMTAEKPSIGMELLRLTGLMRKILPEMLTTWQVQQNKFHKYDVYHHLLYTLDAASPDNLCVRLSALFHDISKPYTKTVKEDKENASFYNHEIISSIVAKKVLKRMRYSNEIIDRVEKLVKFHMFYYTEDWTDSAVRRFLRKVGLDLLDDLFLLREADRVGNGTKYEKSKHLLLLKERIQKVIEQENAFTVKHLKINGKDIMRIKRIKPSPVVGKILNHLLEQVIDDPGLNDKKILEEMVKKFELS